MNEQVRESGIASGLRIAFAIVATFLVMGFTTSFALWATVLNNHFWHDLMLSDDAMEILTDSLDVSLEEFILDSNPNAHLDLDDEDEITEALVTVVMQDYIELVLDGDRDVDEDRFDEFFDEYGDELMEAFDGQYASERQLREECKDSFQEKLDEYYDQLQDEDYYEMFKNYNDWVRNNIINMAVTGILIVIGMVVLLIIHKNKFRPVRAFGISVTVAETLNLLFWGFIALMMNMVIEEESDGTAIVELISDFLTKSMSKIIICILFALILGIVMIVVGAIGAKNKTAQVIEE